MSCRLPISEEAVVAPDPSASERSPWTAVLPIKAWDRAKRRLDRPDRESLAAAFAADTIQACLGCRLVGTVVVVSPEPLATEDDRVRHAVDPGRGLNDAVRSVTRALPVGTATVVLVADLPCLDPAALTSVLTAGGRLLTVTDTVVVADHRGTGTSMLLGRAPGPEPLFGHDSLRRHRAAGATALVGEAGPAARLDVDDESDLRTAVALGVGPATRRALDA